MVKCSQCRYVLAAWVLWLGLGLGAGSQAWAQAAAAGLPPDLQAFIVEALQANPEIKQMRGQYTASKETIRPAGAFDDPEVAFTMKDIPTDNWALNQESMTQKMLELSQKFPFPASAASGPKSPPSKPIPTSISIKTKPTKSGLK